MLCSWCYQDIDCILGLICRTLYNCCRSNNTKNHKWYSLKGWVQHIICILLFHKVSIILLLSRDKILMNIFDTRFRLLWQHMLNIHCLNWNKYDIYCPFPSKILFCTIRMCWYQCMTSIQLNLMSIKYSLILLRQLNSIQLHNLDKQKKMSIFRNQPYFCHMYDNYHWLYPNKILVDNLCMWDCHYNRDTQQ